jgi:hypothetical protein
MTLASNYAQVITELGVAGIDTTVKLMKSKGHLSLLPQVMKILERSEGSADTLTVAHERDAYKLHTRFPGAKVVIDPTVVGGYRARKGSKLIDASYRKALVTIYKNVIQN